MFEKFEDHQFYITFFYIIYYNFKLFVKKGKIYINKKERPN